MKIFGKEFRNKAGQHVNGPITAIKSWWLSKQIRKGKVPHGRTITPEEVRKAIRDGYSGVMGEIWGILSIKVIRGDGRHEDLGVVSVQKVTTAFVTYLVDAMQNSTTSPVDIFKYHGVGTGTTAEANSQTALVTEVGSRATGTSTETSALVYKSVGTVTPGGTYAITEHGIFSASSAGTLMDRSVFAAINVVAVDSIQFTYECTFTAEA